MISKENISEAHDRIRTYVHRTPVMTSQGIDDIAGCKLFFKCENLQNVGAFKARGAMNAALVLPAEQRTKGIAAHSSGNHAQAVARAAKMLGIKAFIVMPKTVSIVKKKGVEGYGAETFECENNIQSRETTLAEVIRKTGANEIHPFNNDDVITGQATAAKELFEDYKDLDFIIAPVGGGGLISGTALAAKYFSPNTQVIAAEPEGADDAFRSMKSGKIEPSQSNTIADGLLTTIGERNFAIIRENVKEVITVSDQQIAEAMRLMWERLKLIVEPSAAVALAAILKSREKFFGKKIGIIISGGNVDLEKALKIMTSVQ
jgi:threonine dehydratase